MACLMLHFFFLIPVVSGVLFNLTHERVENTFFLTCTVQYDTIDPKRIQFWINETNKINILGMSKRVSWTHNIIAFDLKPQYEGTFYCGEENGDVSNGLGPFAASPSKNKEYSTTITKYGSSTTFLCPFTLGALSQAYYVTWDNVTPAYFPTEYEVGHNSENKPFLTLLNIRKKNIGTYTCNVAITDLYDGVVWKRTGTFQLYYYCSACKTARDTAISVILSLPCCAILCLMCFNEFFGKCCCERQNRRTPNYGGRCQRRRRPRIPRIFPELDDDYKYLKIQKNKNIGNGAFGSVFKGKYKNSPCAAKLLTHHAQQMATGGHFETAAGIQKEALEAFRKECAFLKHLRHDNIVQHLATVTEPKSKLPVLVMELMDCNLKQHLEKVSQQKKKALPLCRQINLCLQIAQGLEYLHSENIIHRDLCDVNILINYKGDDKCPQAKVADFGMSRILPYHYISATLTGLGHRQVYLPPEAPEDHYSYPLDIYSFGVIAVQIVHVKTLLKKKSEVQSLLEEIPDDHSLKWVISSCLSEDRKSRPLAAYIINVITSDN